MSILTVSTPFNLDLEFRIAPFHKRIGAWLIDALICTVYFVLIFKYVLPDYNRDDDASNFTALFTLFIAIPLSLYHLLFEIFMNGQSVGKRALNIKVMDMSGNQASVGQYLLRWILRPIDTGIFGIVAIFSIALTKYSQRLGDLTAGTVVIDNKYMGNLDDTIYLDLPDEGYKPMFPQVMKLTDRDINGIRNILYMKENSRDANVYIAQVVMRIKEVLQIESDLELRDFLWQLLHDYNFLTRK